MNGNNIYCKLFSENMKASLSSYSLYDLILQLRLVDIVSCCEEIVYLRLIWELRQNVLIVFFLAVELENVLNMFLKLCGKACTGNKVISPAI